MVGVIWTFALSLAWAFKGLPALSLVPLGFATAFVLRRCGAVLWAMGAGCVLAAAGLWGFDVWYDAQSGQSFLMRYLGAQVGPSMGHGFSCAQKVTNLFYYAARPLWFAQPALTLVLYGVWRRRNLTQQSRWLNAAPGYGGFGFALGLGALGLFVAAFALADRKADRYLFPAYPLVALCAAVQFEALEKRARTSAMSCLRRPKVTAFVGASVLMAAIALKIYVGMYHYKFIRWWPGA